MRLPFRVDQGRVPQMLRFGLSELRSFLWDRIRRAPPRVEQALTYVRANARAGDPEDVLRTLDRFGRDHSFLMNVGDRKGEILDAEVQRHRPARALEIGAFCGYSAVRIARLLREWNGRLWSIEANGRNAEVARKVVEYAGLADRVEVIHGPAETVIPTLTEPFDLVFIDHWKDLYLPDLKRLEARDLIRAGAVVVADNVGLFDVDDYLDYVRNSGRYDSRNVASTVEYRDEMADAVEISVRRADA